MIVYLILWILMPNERTYCRYADGDTRLDRPTAGLACCRAVTDRTVAAWPLLSGLLSSLLSQLTPASVRPAASAAPHRLRSPVITTPDLRGHTVLALHAHPDDEAIFTGITLRRLADAGARTVLVIATAGELGSSRVPLRPGETIPATPDRRAGARRRAARGLPAGAARAARLRPARLASAAHRRALAAADPLPLARRVAELADDEGAGDARSTTTSTASTATPTTAPPTGSGPPRPSWSARPATG